MLSGLAQWLTAIQNYTERRPFGLVFLDEKGHVAEDVDITEIRIHFWGRMLILHKNGTWEFIEQT